MNPRVLLVEDEPLVRSIMRETLSDEGFDVTEACDGDEAVDRLRHCPAFDLLFTDVHMPGRLDGLGVAALARAAHPALPIVVVTGRPEVGRTIDALMPRCVFLTKPYTLSAVLGAIGRARAHPGRAATSSSHKPPCIARAAG